MVVILGHISHICGNWKHKPKPHGAAHGVNRSHEILETIADNLSEAGWSWGCVSVVDSRGRTIFVADTRRDALVFNTAGSNNMALGQGALAKNLTGSNNTAMGFQALNLNTVDGNVAVGFQALKANSTAADNVAVGFQALVSKTGGSFNTALGFGAGSRNVTGTNNIYIGDAGFTSSESNVIAIGAISSSGTDYDECFVGGISGVVVTGAPVLVQADGQLGVAASSARFKEQIKPMDKASEAIFALKPVTFRYKQDIDPDHIRMFGLLAEEVEKVNPDLVSCDKEGKPFTVRYEQINAMMLNEFLKEHSTVQELKATVAEQQKQIAALTAGLQKVSAQVEMNRTAPHMVVNDQ